MKKTNWNQDDIIDLHNEAHEIFKIPLKNRTSQQQKRLDEILDIIYTKNEEYEAPIMDKLFENDLRGNYFKISAKIGNNTYQINVENSDDCFLAHSILKLYAGKFQTTPPTQ